MMTFEMQIACDNQAFDHGHLNTELARILRHEADGLEEAGAPETGETLIRDVNGNRVGYARLHEGTEPITYPPKRPPQA